LLSIIIPAYNEEKNLEKTIKNINKVLLDLNFKDFEIIIINDGSIDNTKNVMHDIQHNYNNIVLIHNSKNKGIGYSFKKSIKICKYDRVTIFPGDNYSSYLLIKNLIKNYNKADIVISYTINTELRSKLRFALSTLYTLAHYLLFSSPFKYINGSAVIKLDQLKKIKIQSNSYTFFSEILIKLFRSGSTYMEVFGTLNKGGLKSSALNLKVMIAVIKYFFSLVIEIHLLKKNKYNKFKDFKRIIN